MLLPFSYNGETPTPWQWQAASANTYKVGDALRCSTGGIGVLGKCTGSNKPDYICMADVTVSTAGELIPVIPVSENVIYQTKLAVSSSSIMVGTAYTIHTDGASITSTSTGGVARVVSYNGKTANSLVCITFVAPPASTSST